MDANRKSSISAATSNEAMGEFWDAHDFTEYDAGGPDVPIEVTRDVPIERDLFDAITEAARRQGVNVETLVNLWLQEKVTEQTHRASA